MNLCEVFQIILSLQTPRWFEKIKKRWVHAGCSCLLGKKNKFETVGFARATVFACRSCEIFWSWWLAVQFSAGGALPTDSARELNAFFFRWAGPRAHFAVLRPRHLSAKAPNHCASYFTWKEDASFLIKTSKVKSQFTTQRHFRGVFLLINII